MKRRARLFVFVPPVAVAIAIAVGCGHNVIYVIEAAPDAAVEDVRADRGQTTPDPGDDDDDDVAKDAGTKDAAADATKDARPGFDANGPGGDGEECSLNYDCQLALRCECNDMCACKSGARGAGKNGVDACDSGNDCTSAICLEGPGNAMICSDQCAGPEDCPAKLPLCQKISFIGQICIRSGP